MGSITSCTCILIICRVSILLRWCNSVHLLRIRCLQWSATSKALVGRMLRSSSEQHLLWRGGELVLSSSTASERGGCERVLLGGLRSGGEGHGTGSGCGEGGKLAGSGGEGELLGLIGGGGSGEFTGELLEVAQAVVLD